MVEDILFEQELCPEVPSLRWGKKSHRLPGRLHGSSGISEAEQGKR
jgi:hypothetical protein